jgi:hypothetical protein
MTILNMYRGDDRTLTITADESLTGSEITFTAKRRKRDDSPVLISKTTAAGITIGEDEEDTSAIVTLDAADTEDLDPGKLWWDIEIVDVLGKVHTVAEGHLRLLRDASRLEGS